MGKTIFISDFDGTISTNDFYKIIIEDYIGTEAKEYYINWKRENKIDVEFLNKIFSWYQFNDIEHDELLFKVAIDETFNEYIKWWKSSEREFIVLSAGFRYYIEKVMSYQGNEDIEIITNEGEFKEGNFIIQPSKEAWYYHEGYGVDKGEVIKRYKEEYDTVIFAGDSEPDYQAAIHADICFAKSELAELLQSNGQPYHLFEKFIDIKNILNEKYELL